jgi:hypothetical protein
VNSASFEAFSKVLGFNAPIDALAVYKSLDPSATAPYSLGNLMAQFGTPVPPTGLTLYVPQATGYPDSPSDSLGWIDPSASYPPTPIREATSWTITIWPPSGGPVATSLTGIGYYFSGPMPYGNYKWQVTAINSYGESLSQIASFDIPAPPPTPAQKLWTGPSSESLITIVYGSGFPNDECPVTIINGGGKFGNMRVSGNIVKGIPIQSPCDPGGGFGGGGSNQHYTIQATCAGLAQPVQLTINC